MEQSGIDVLDFLAVQLRAIRGQCDAALLMIGTVKQSELEAGGGPRGGNGELLSADQIRPPTFNNPQKQGDRNG